MDGAALAAGPSLEQDTAISAILEALNVIYDPRSSNEQRKNATLYLENTKSTPSAPLQGYSLATDKTKDPTVRHYGISMLEYKVRYGWDDEDRDEIAGLKGWTMKLAQDVSPNESAFLRNKIAKLWVEVAKRCWPDDWMDMDEMLCRLWEESLVHQAIVLQVLETIAEEFFTKDTQGKSADLTKACVEVFTPSRTLQETFPDRKVGLDVRYGDEGWVRRLLVWLQWCLSASSHDGPQVQLLLQVLAVIQSTMPWIIMPALLDTPFIDLMCKALEVSDVSVQTAVLDCFHALYHRSQYSDVEVEALICPLMSTEGISLIRRSYETNLVNAEDIDEPQYLHLKKLAEVVCALSSFLEQRPNLVTCHVDVPKTLQFLVLVLQNRSLVVSIPVLYSWTKILACPSSTVSDAVLPLIGDLLETCSSRLLRYEALPAGTSEPTLLFLQEDFDTIPERHAFIGNYRRFCTEVVEKVVRKSPFEAIRHIVSQADNLIRSLYQSGNDFSQNNYSSSSAEILRVDAQTTIVTSAVKGYMSWLHSQQQEGQTHGDAHAQLQQDMEQWCITLLSKDLPDPAIQKRLLQLVGEITMAALDAKTSVPLKICDYIFTKGFLLVKSLGHTPYQEALNELQSSLPRLLQKLAIRYPDTFMSVFDDLQTHMEKTKNLDGGKNQQRNNAELQAVLFIIIQRTSKIDLEEKSLRLRQILDPLFSMWRSDEFGGSLADFGGFCTLLGLEEVPQYFVASGAHSIADWSSQKLDDKGVQLQKQVRKQPNNLPLLFTRAFLGVSTERVRPGSAEYEVARAQWQVGIPIILPTLLQLISHAHAFSNPSKWSDFPTEMQIIIRRTLQDRVWQSGISSETRDDFYKRIQESESTLEGLGSATRAAVRDSRELSYWILHCMSQFGDTFYQHEDLAEPLARVLYEDANMLSSNQLSHLLSLTTALTDNCPTKSRFRYFPPLLTNIFKQVDHKISTEWATLTTQADGHANDDGLTQEMKAESVLRTLTWSAVSFAFSLVSSTPPPQMSQLAPSHPESTQSITRQIVLSSSSILSNLIPFSEHMLRVHDTRSVSLITRVLRTLLLEFAKRSSYPNQPNGTDKPLNPATGTSPETGPIIEYFASDILKSAIMSLHEPYFADCQKDLAALIASILWHTSTLTTTARAVLLSLPGMTDVTVDRALARLREVRGERQQRNLVLELLEGLKGVSIPEQGKIFGPGVSAVGLGKKKSRKSAMQEQFAMALDDGDQGPSGERDSLDRRRSPELGGVAELLG